MMTITEMRARAEWKSKAANDTATTAAVRCEKLLETMLLSVIHTEIRTSSL